MMRKKLNRKQSSKNFKNGAKTHRQNFASKPMRGGWRI